MQSGLATPGDSGRLRAIIDAARDRARRRRTIYSLVAAGVLALGIWIAMPGGEGPGTGPNGATQKADAARDCNGPACGPAVSPGQALAVERFLAVATQGDYVYCQSLADLGRTVDPECQELLQVDKSSLEPGKPARVVTVPCGEKTIYGEVEVCGQGISEEEINRQFAASQP